MGHEALFTDEYTEHMRELLKKTSGKQGKIAYLQGKVVFLYKYINTFVYLHGSRKSLPFFLLFSFFKITINNIWFHYIFLNKIVNFSSYSFPTTLASLVPFHPLTHTHSITSFHSFLLFCVFYIASTSHFPFLSGFIPYIHNHSLI